MRLGKTEVKLPLRHVLADEATEADLLAVGVRVKKIAFARVKVYVGGVYLDVEKARKRNKTLREVATDVEVMKTMRMHFVREVKGETIAKVIAESVEKKMRGNKENEEALREFREMFEGVKIDKGACLTFSTDKQGDLTTTLRTKQLRRIRNERLCGAIFESWLNREHSVIPELTEAAEKKFAAAVAA